MNEVGFEGLRKRYKPSKVRVLFVGESPPINGVFFFQGDGNLVRYTQEAFSNVYGRQYQDVQGFLNHFRELGCYLDDLCLMPVNHLSERERREVRQKAVSSLAERMREASPQAIIIVMRAIEQDVRSAVTKASLNQVRIYPLPFPAQGNQRRYVAELINTLGELRREAILPS